MQYPTLNKLEFILNKYGTSYSVKSASKNILGSIVIPETYRGLDVVAIADSGFENCFEIEMVEIPSKLSKIGNNSFCGCSHLRSIKYGLGFSSLVEIGDFAFFNCSSLSINVPKTVAKIGINALKGCFHFSIHKDNPFLIVTEDKCIKSKITDEYIYLSENTKVFKIPKTKSTIDFKFLDACESLVNIEIDEENPYFSSFDGAVFDKTGTRLLYIPLSKVDITIPKSTTIIDFSIIPTKAQTITIELGNTSFSSFDGAIYNKEKTKLLFCPYSKKELLLPKNVVEVSSDILKKCFLLNKINVEEENKYYSSIDGILYDKEKNKLLFCPIGTSSLKIYSSNIVINEKNKINCLIISPSIKTVDYDLMRKFPLLRKLIIESKKTHLLDNSLIDNTTIEEIHFCLEDMSFPDFIKRVFGAGVFSSWWFKIRKVVLLEGKHLPDKSFYNMQSIMFVSISSKTLSIGNKAFYHCSSLESITIPDSVTSIGDSVFYGCTSLSSITIGNGVTSIGEYAFSGCTSLTSITIPNGITSIRKMTFHNCSSLESIIIPNSVALIEYGAFCRCTSLKSIIIPCGITSISEWSFAGCLSLVSLILPNTIISIGERAFDCCGKLKQITFKGTISQWKKISFGKGWRFSLALKVISCIDGDIVL